MLDANAVVDRQMLEDSPVILSVAGDIPEVEIGSGANVVLIELEDASFREVRQQVPTIPASYFGSVMDLLAIDRGEDLGKVVLRYLSVGWLIKAARLVIGIHLAEDTDTDGVRAKLLGDIVAPRTNQLIDE